jgi:hypothetical protein
MIKPADLFENVKRVLMHDWDPIGIRDVPQAQDEYDDYARQIARMLAAGISIADLSKDLLEIETGSMGLPGDSGRANAVARKLWQIGNP